MAAPAETGQTTTGAVPAQTSGVDLSHMNFLAAMDQIIIKQPVRGSELFMEQCCGCEMSNYYEAEKVTEDGNKKTIEKLFVMHEESNFCMRQCCGAQRALVLNAVMPEADPQSAPMFQVIKPYRMGCCCCSSDVCMGRAYMEVMVAGKEIGSIREDCICNCEVNYSVYDCNDQLLCTLKRFFCHCELSIFCFYIFEYGEQCIHNIPIEYRCSKKVPFHIFDADDQETGKAISKEFGGWLTEMFTDADTFLCEFPECMNSVERKLLLIGAAMMIEFKLRTTAHTLSTYF